MNNMRIALGSDIVDIVRIKKIMKTFDNHFLNRFFSDYEISYAKSKSNTAIHLAGFWAAKEAAYKAFGFGFAASYNITHQSNGKPVLNLPKGLTRPKSLDVSISHIENVAFAAVVAIFDDNDSD